MLDDVDRQLAMYREDMQRQYGLRFSEIEKVLLEMEQRGHAYFDEMFRIGRMLDLFNRLACRKDSRGRSSATRRSRSSVACPSSSTGSCHPISVSGRA